MASLTVPKVATAVVFDQHKGPLRVERKWPVVEPEVGEVLVKIAYSGVCRESTAVAAIRKEGGKELTAVTACPGGVRADSDLHAWSVSLEFTRS